VKPGKDPKFPQNVRQISLLSTTGKRFEKVILKIIKRHIKGRNLLNASQFGFHERHSTTLQCTRLVGHVALNFNNKMSMPVVFMDLEKAFDTTWHHALLCKLSKLEFSTSVIKLITSFLAEQNSESRWKAKCLHQGTCKKECLNVPSCPVYHTIQFVH
jgi:hypothetical protein